jgi:hypothetical protein
MKLSRRQLMLLSAGVPVGAALAQTRPTSLKTTPKTNPAAAALPALAPDDDKFLDDLERQHFQYFWEQTNPKTGLIKDRWDGTNNDKGIVASIAATGFGLTALCIGHERGFAPPGEIRSRVLAALNSLWKDMPNHRGFFYHWANINTGERMWDSEVSSIDTALLLCGVLSCREYFASGPIERLASAVFNRVEWTWAAEDTALVSHGWMPEAGFLPYRWDYYSELVIMNLLGLGSSSHPLPESSWDAWKRTWFEYGGLRYIGSFAPLFVHQYPQAWFDLRGKRDRYADYFQNSISATEAHRLFCLDLRGRFPDYSNDLWGITASDSPHGYQAWGGPPAMGPIDGTVAPAAAGGSLVFVPAQALRVLKNIRARFGDRAWRRYGLIDAFNPHTNWYDPASIGIDTGVTLLMAENLRTGFVWKIFMKSAEAKRGIERAGFEDVSEPHTG